jgi:hypothetical protein
MLFLVGCAGSREPYYPNTMGGGYYPRNVYVSPGGVPGGYNRGHGYYGEYRRHDVVIVR